MKKRAFTLMELLIVITIIAILFSLLFPALHKARKKAQTAQCMGNLKQISTAGYLYLMDNNKNFPDLVDGKQLHQGRIWIGKKGTDSSGFGKDVTQRPMNAYLGYTQDGIETPMTACPFDSLGEPSYHKNGSNYFGNAYVGWASLKNKKLTVIKDPAITVMFAEIGAYTYQKSNKSKWWRMNHESGIPRYPYVNADGSVFQYRVSKGEGKDFPSAKVNINLGLL